MKKWLAMLFVLAGGILATLGAIFIGMYIWEAVIARIGDPDQSPLFWYLPMLLFGVIGLAGGVVLLIAGVRRLRNSRDKSP